MSRSRREIQVAMAMTLALVAGVLIFCVASGLSRNFDFAGCYSAGLIARQSGFAQVYDVQEQARAQQTLHVGSKLFLIAYPPFQVLIFAQFARLPYAAAYVLWGLMNLALWAVFAIQMRSFAPRPRDALHYLMLCFFFLPAWAAVVLGQNSMILLLVYFFTWKSLQQGQDFQAGAYLGLGLLKYHLVLPFAIILLLRGKFKAVAGFGLVGLLLVAVSFAAAGTAGVSAFVHLVLDIVRQPANPAYESFSPRHIMPTILGGYSALLGSRVPGTWITALAGLTSLALLIFTAWRWRRAEKLGMSDDSSIMFGSALVATLLITPHLYTYDLTLMLLVMLLMFNSERWRIDSSWRRTITIAAAILYAPLYPLLFSHGASYVLIPPMLVFALSGTGHPEPAKGL
jgi:hypothetical protein